ncbi:MAG: adenylate/guanylate cyclase domain-containing protein [Candidatus Riflebacteria bacterium]|nr:adenylate/guanylate cyclase domain-containing protein [Candidatus Riflebacteria bacterium]
MKAAREISPIDVQWKTFKGVLLFSDLSIYFGAVKKMSLIDLAEFLKIYYSHWRSEIFRQKGEILNMLGDQIVVSFKAELCGGADPEWCAALSAFHVLKDLKKWREDIELSIGINSGETLEGSWEENGTKKYVVAGDLINKTAHLASGKNRGIIASRNVAEILGPRVICEKNYMKLLQSGEEETVFRLVSLKL